MQKNPVLIGACIRKLTGVAAVRWLLAGLLTVTVIADARAQIAPPPPPPPTTQPQAAPPSSSNSSRNTTYIIGGIVIGIIGIIIANQVFAKPPDRLPDLPPQPEPDFSRISVNPSAAPPQVPPRGTLSGTPSASPLRRGFNLPRVGETRFVPNEVLLEANASVSTRALDAAAARLGLTRLESVRIALLGRTLHRWRIDRGDSVPSVITALSKGPFFGAQPNYLFETTQNFTLNSDQYAPVKLHIPDAHRLATGNQTLVAVIDSTVDAEHPDLAGAIVANFNATGDTVQPHPHGTGMAGAIAARHSLLGVAPRVGLVTVSAFSPKANTAEGTSMNILKGLDFAVERGVRIINMSFAGPSDPRLQEALLKASNRGAVLIAASGNAGPDSPPLYPAADPNVIAVTAIDVNDALFSRAVRGNHIAVAAPGVNILVPAPEGAYQLTTGTSVAAAQVSGIVALMIERNPKLTAKEIRAILMRTARDLGPKGRDREFGAGLVDALRAVTAARE